MKIIYYEYFQFYNIEIIFKYKMKYKKWLIIHYLSFWSDKLIGLPTVPFWPEDFGFCDHSSGFGFQIKLFGFTKNYTHGQKVSLFL